MSYQIDQSGKIEQTSKVTVIALSNSKQASIILKAKDKRDLQGIFRQAGKPKVFTIQVFSALTYLLGTISFTLFAKKKLSKEKRT